MPPTPGTQPFQSGPPDTCLSPKPASRGPEKSPSEAGNTSSGRARGCSWEVPNRICVVCYDSAVGTAGGGLDRELCSRALWTLRGRPCVPHCSPAQGSSSAAHAQVRPLRLSPRRDTNFSHEEQSSRPRLSLDSTPAGRPAVQV